MKSWFLFCSTNIFLFVALPIVTHAASCTGKAPANATLCANDNKSVTVNTPFVLTDQCTDAKCEYTCKAGFVRSGDVCVQCTGTVPKNAALCANDDADLATNTVRTLTDQCTDAKCEYTCNDGFVKYKNTCVGCTGTTPSNAQMCSSDDQGLTANVAKTVKSSCTDKTKCEYTCNPGFAKDPKTQNCVYPCLNAQSSSKATICPGDDQGVGVIAITSTVKKFGSQCTDKTKCEFICKEDYMLEGGKCIPKQCSNNTKPALQSSDPECWTSQTTSSSKVCTWDCTYPYYACDDGVHTTDPNGGTNCQPYLNACYDDCGNYAGCSNRTDGIAHGVTYTLITYSTTFDCHYITVNTWGDCNVDTGVQLATSVTQNIAKNTKDCTNLSQATVRYCGICGNGVQEADEVCDDGNQIDGDGCSSICRLEIGEPTDGPTDGPTNPPFDPRDYTDDPSDGNGSDADDDNNTRGRMIETRP
jgi:cysteine-rich repeat protein